MQPRAPRPPPPTHPAQITLQGFPDTGDYSVKRTIIVTGGGGGGGGGGDAKSGTGGKSARTQWALNGEHVTADVIAGLMTLL